MMTESFHVKRSVASTVIGFHQDSGVAEYGALESVIEHGSGELHVVTDHKNVSDSWEYGRSYCVSYKHPFCHIWKKVFDYVDRPGNGLRITWVKAHRNLGELGETTLLKIGLVMPLLISWLKKLRSEQDYRGRYWHITSSCLVQSKISCY